jgi:hypothetical protein
MVQSKRTFLSFLFFWDSTHYVAQCPWTLNSPAQPPKCWAYRCVLPCPPGTVFFFYSVPCVFTSSWEENKSFFPNILESGFGWGDSFWVCPHEWQPKWDCHWAALPERVLSLSFFSGEILERNLYDTCPWTQSTAMLLHDAALGLLAPAKV